MDPTPNTAAATPPTIAVYEAAMSPVIASQVLSGLGGEIAAALAREVNPVALLKAIGWFQLAHPADFKLADNLGAVIAAADTVFPDAATRPVLVQLLQGLATLLGKPAGHDPTPGPFFRFYAAAEGSVPPPLPHHAALDRAVEPGFSGTLTAPVKRPGDTP